MYIFLIVSLQLSVRFFILSLLKVGTWQELMPKVARGKYSLISLRHHISVIVASHFADKQGHTPIYISPTNVFTFPSFGWAFRLALKKKRNMIAYIKHRFFFL